MISPFIDPVTYAKINFVKGTPEEIGATLAESYWGQYCPGSPRGRLRRADRVLYHGGVYMGLSKSKPARLERTDRLPHTTKETLPTFKSILGEELTAEELESCKAAFAVTYQQLIEESF